MIGDPYEEADEKQRQEAKLVAPVPAKKNRKIVLVALVAVAFIVSLIIFAHVVSLLTTKAAPDSHPAPRPVTMTRQQSETFARQQAGEAAYMKGVDRDGKRQDAEDTVLGDAGDAYDEADGVPKKTKAQNDAEHGRTSNGQGQSEAQQLRERAALAMAHRRQNDLDSSPVSIDFSDYFEKQKDAAEKPEQGATPPVVPTVPTTTARRSAVSDVLNQEESADRTDTEASSKKPHDPAQDYEFDSAAGKLYRLMEDTVLETVLVNRLSGAAVGPVITMITENVYSSSGKHLLIPKGTRLVGRISSVSSLNQERLFVAFHRMIMPDGYSVSLDKFQGLDVVGQTGLRDLVNHHYVQIFGSSLALAGIAATAQVGNSSSFGTYDWGTQMRNGVSEGLSQSAQRVMERFMNVLPTFTIRDRARVKVLLAGDLLLPDTKNHTMDPDL